MKKIDVNENWRVAQIVGVHLTPTFKFYKLGHEKKLY